MFGRSTAYPTNTHTHIHTHYLAAVATDRHQGTAIDFAAAAAAAVPRPRLFPPKAAAAAALPELKWERFVSPFSASPSKGRFLESAISGEGHVSIPESAAILVGGSSDVHRRRAGTTLNSHPRARLRLTDPARPHGAPTNMSTT